MKTQFLTSAADPAGFPDNQRAEFAFFGRSNVGKSSLLNRLAGARVARVSRTPGRTQLINFFDVDAGSIGFRLADLPGYGFARAPAHVVDRFEALVLAYLNGRRLKAGLLLFDIRRTVAEDDLRVWQLLRSTVGERGALLWPVLTKADKVPKSKRKPAASTLARILDAPPGDVVLTSSSEGQGLETLRERLQRAAGPAVTKDQ